MTSSRSRKNIVIIVLAISLTLLSLTYVRPSNCQQLCAEPEYAPCPSGACRFGEQRAGFPLPIVVDAPGGGSPTSGWGKLGAEDMPDPLFFLMDAAFYAALIWIVWFAAQRIRERKKVTRQTLIPLAAPLAILLICAFVAIRLTQAMHPVQDISTPQTALLGNWRLTGEGFIFGFYEDGRLMLTSPSSTERDLGSYQWVSAGTIRISFTQSYPLAEPEAALCARAPSFLKSYCRSNPDKPMSALAADNSVAFVPTLLPAYPAPTPIPVGVSRIEITLDVSLNGDVLALTDPNGSVQELRRVIR